ncbi:preprotein translocase subunit SecE [Gloeocapsopsis dulcis]|uniref:Protein translocase subunit SecE n=1 Tax=Gloeocapsopsis dulcis AAB1 = 1H9 TaxID=1433147 RepID=A0A6N8FVW9_9CHRO|nr:preprotein translocase subunit SecE [Gloeocapsopsis dulcis AAB1 = 1H9]
MNKKNEVEIQEPKSGSNISNFFKGTKEEFDKVVWPSRQQLVSESAAVLSMIVLSATFIYLVNGFFAWGAGQVFR